MGHIKRYLKLGVMENGLLVKTTEGSPQGGPLSPLLAKCTERYARWCERTVTQLMGSLLLDFSSLFTFLSSLKENCRFQRKDKREKVQPLFYLLQFGLPAVIMKLKVSTFNWN